MKEEGDLFWSLQKADQKELVEINTEWNLIDIKKKQIINTGQTGIEHTVMARANISGNISPEITRSPLENVMEGHSCK